MKLTITGLTEVLLTDDLPTIPKTIFRFRPFDNPIHRAAELDALRRHCGVFFTRQSQFNDKYDSLIGLQRANDHDFAQLRDEIIFSRAKVDDVTQVIHYLHPGADYWRRRNLFFQDFSIKLRDVLCNMFFCACFCESPVPLVMWYHYANRYRGICYELVLDLPEDRMDTARIFFSTEFKLRSVKYVDERACLTENQLFKLWMAAEGSSRQNPRANARFIEQTFFEKSSEGAYEKEVRVLVNIMPQDEQTGTVRGYKQMHPYKLASIILGPDVDSCVKTDVEQFCQTYNIPLKRTALLQNRYGVRIFDK